MNPDHIEKGCTAYNIQVERAHKVSTNAMNPTPQNVFCLHRPSDIYLMSLLSRRHNCQTPFDTPNAATPKNAQRNASNRKSTLHEK